MRIKIEWDFTDTDYENLQYKEALELAGLPTYLDLEFDEDDDMDIDSYISENYYGFDFSWNED